MRSPGFEPELLTWQANVLDQTIRRPPRIININLCLSFELKVNKLCDNDIVVIWAGSSAVETLAPLSASNAECYEYSLYGQGFDSPTVHFLDILILY